MLTLTFYQCSSSDNLNKDVSFTFDKGVVLNHWTFFPIPDAYEYADEKWYNKNDSEWIAKQGFDQIVLNISVKEIFNGGKTLDSDKTAPIDSSIQWSNEVGIGMILNFVEFPKFDTLLNKDLKQMRISCWEQIVSKFKSNGTNVRILINPIGEAEINDNKEYLKNITALYSKLDQERFYYLKVNSVKAIPDYKEMLAFKHSIPLIDCWDIGQYSENKTDLISEFAWQFSNDSLSKSNTYPGSYNSEHLSKETFSTIFGNINRGLDVNEINKTVYLSNFAYYVGWPFNPKSQLDTTSINQFAQDFKSSAEANRISWSIYDYKSGCAVNLDNKPSVFLESLKLKKSNK